jgi:hypothetical protein
MIAKSRELAVLDHASRMLDEAKSLEEIKSIRDKAEAARNYVKAAKLGLELQNCAAEVKLRAERKAGRLLRSLKLRGGDRKSKRHPAPLKLAELGISRDQSKRWQHIASVSDAEFTRYLKSMGDQGREITSAGLLRIAAKFRPKSRSEPSPARNDTNLRPNKNCSAHEMLEELINHCKLLGDILLPVYEEDDGPELKRGERRVVGHLIGEMTTLIVQLKRTCRAVETE